MNALLWFVLGYVAGAIVMVFVIAFFVARNLPPEV